MDWSRKCETSSGCSHASFEQNKLIQAHLKPTIDNGETFEAMLLSCINNEEYYYQYLVEMASSRLPSLSFDLKMARNKKSDIRKFTKEKLIGKGDFSKVYLVYDTETRNKFAVKKMKAINSKYPESMENIFQLFRERDALLTVAKSPFIINLIDSFRSDDHRSVFFVFEYCPANLTAYIKLLNAFSLKEFSKLYFSGQLFDKCMQFTREKYNFDVSYVNLIYSFELLAAIAFLADKNVVHCDIKFENILISNSGHLKLADLGNVQRFRWFDRQSRALLTIPGEWENHFQKNSEFVPHGNYIFADPEITHQIYSYLYKDKDLMANFESLGKVFVKNTNSFYDYEFLSDIFSIGEIIFALYSNGRILSYFGSFSYQIIIKYLKDKISKCEASTLIWKYQIFYDIKTYFEVIYHPLKKVEKSPGISKLLIEIFKRRDQRALNITKSTNVWYKWDSRKMLRLNMEVIERLPIFKKLDININTVSARELPYNLLELLFENEDIEDDLLSCSVDDEENVDTDFRYLPMSMLDFMPVTEYTLNKI